MKTYVGAHPELAAFGAWASSAPWTGTSPARQVLKARILLKADASEAGEAWSDGQIAEALDTSIDTIAPHAPAAGGGRPRCSPDPQALPQLRQKAYFRRCRRGQVDRARLLSAAERAQAVDASCHASAGPFTSRVCGARHLAS
jgi:hypothetical protein